MPRLLLLVPTKTYRAGAFVSAAKRLDIAVTLASEEPNSLAEYLPADLITLDFADPARCGEQAADFARRHPIDAVVGVDDGVTLAAAAIGEALGLRHNSTSSSYATRNKHVMRERLAAAGVPQPAYRRIAANDDPVAVARSIRYPVVIKPLMLSASRGVVKVRNNNEFYAAFDMLRELSSAPGTPDDPDARRYFLVEEYVPGWEVAVEGIVTDGALHVFTIFDKPDPLEGPYFAETIYTSPSRLPAERQRRIIAVTGQAVRAIGLAHGPIHAELRGDGERVWLVEIAARSIGGYCSRVLRFAGGRSLEDVIVTHALDPTRAVPALEEGAAGVLMLQAPRAGRFVEARGIDRAGEVAGIDEIIVSAHPGQRLEPLPRGFLYVAFAFARGADPDVVERALRLAEEAMEFVIE